MNVVSDTGPLIALAKVEHLDLLRHLFAQVQIPPAVQAELLAKTGPEGARLEEALVRFVKVKAVHDPPPGVRAAVARLGRGEQQAVVLAHELEATLLMDDRLGRAAAHRLGLPVTGLAGILIRAKEKGLLDAVRPLLEGIRSEGYWLSDALLAAAARMAGET